MDQYDMNQMIQAVLSELQKKEQIQTGVGHPKTLLIYTGAKIGFDASLESVRQLREKGYRFDVFYTQGAEKALDISAIRNNAEPERILKDCGEETPEQFAAQYDTIVVPALTTNTAAKLSSCIMDSPVTRMLFSGLAKGKRVLLATDGCCPDHPARESLGYCMTEPLKKQMRENLSKLKGFGAELTSAEKLATAVMGEKTKQPDVSSQQPVSSVQKGKRTLITRKQVDECPVGGTLAIPQNSNVTALAQDLALERGITIVKE